MYKYLFLLMTALSCCTPRLVGFDSEDCGGTVGEVACDFEFENNESIINTVWEHHEKVIILDFSAMWCGPCQTASFYSETILKSYPEDEIVWITVLASNMSGQIPTPEDLNTWINHFELYSEQSIVLSGDRDLLRGYSIPSYPTFYFINQDMEITEIIAGWSALLTIQAIDNAFNSIEE